jgi:cellulose biosynthesis protein BcsQ
MANIHLIGGEKGGVGKSIVARLVAQYLIDQSIPFLGFDTDRSHGALLRFYPGYASPLLIDNYDALDAIVEAALDQPDRRILVDLAAQSEDGLTQWMQDSQLLEVAPELGLNIRYWHVMDSGRDSVTLLERLLDRHGSRLNYVLVLNQLRGDDFGILEKSGQKERALALDRR